MAYTLRYYKTFPQPGERDILLEIYEKDGVRPSQEIGSVVQALHLDIQGAQDDVDTPIVKTSLTMVFVDAPDHEESATKKCGNWEEFYTPDSTYWQVILKVRNSHGSFTQIWGGYVTPDSFSEQLRYRGSVTIVARDNIGHMQDFPFDAKGNEDGMITVYDLVNAAWSKIESPMRIDWRGVGDSAIWLQTEGTDAPATYVNVSAFEGMNWYEAVQKVLYSMGMVMRYVGKNVVQVSSLRYMPYMGEESISDLNIIEPIFVSSANRELAPAAKRIEESVSYHLEKGVQIPLADGVDFAGTETTAPFYSTNIFGETIVTNIPVHPILSANGDGWSNMPSSTLFFDPRRYTIREDGLNDDVKRMLYLACNTDGSRSVGYQKTVICRDFRISLTFGRVIQRRGNDVVYCYGFASGTENNGIGSIRVRKVSGYISAEQYGVTHYYTGSGWQADPYKIEMESQEDGFGIDIGFQGMTGVAVVSFFIESIELDAMRDYSDGEGLYVPISSMYWGLLDGQSLCATNSVNTNYIDTNNVIISRSPEIAPALDEVPFPVIIKNGIFVKSGDAYLPAKLWAWYGGTPQQMAVYNHLQLLSYYSKPNNVITGDIVNADLGDIRALYLWQGKEHLMQGGSLNFLNGRIEGAILREFTRYESLWGDVTGDAGLPDVESANTTNVQEGSSASTSGYENNTEVYIGGEGGSITVDSFMSDTSRNPVENRVIKAYVDSETKKAQAAALEVLLKMFEWDGEVIKAKASIYSVGQVSASKKGEEGGGGGGAGMMLLTEWDDSITDLSSYALGANLGKGLRDEIAAMKANPASYITLKTINNQSLFGSGNIDVKTTVEWNDIVGRPTNLSEFTNDKGYITEVTERMIVDATDAIPNSGKVLISTGGTLNWLPYPRNLSDLKDDVVAGKYLPLSGGTMGNTTVYELYTDVWSIGGNPYTLTISRAGSWASALICVKNTHNSENDYAEIVARGREGVIDAFYFAFNNQNYSQAALRITEYALYHKDYPILHSGNYATEIGDYYLKSSGGILSDSWSGGTEIRRKDSNNGYASLIFSQADGTILGRFGFSGVDNPLFITQAGDSKTLIHSGNVENYSVKRSDAIDLSQKNLSAVGYGTTTSGWLIYGPAIAIGHPNGYTMLLQQRTDDNRIHVNRKNPNGIAGGWNTIAFTDSDITGNAATANKLILESGAEYGTFGSDYTEFGLTSRNNYINGSKVIFRNASAQNLLINSSGNVTIGSSDLAGTDAKLAVWGNQRIYRGNVTAEYLDISVADVSVYYNAYDPDGYCHQYFQSNGNTRLFINGYSGNIGIGTTAPAYLLDVAGTGRFAGLASFDAGVKIGTTTLGNTNLGLSINTSFYPLSTGLSLGHSSYRWHNVFANNVRTDEVKIGDATLTWDGIALKVDKPFYSKSQVSAGSKAVEAQAVIAPLALPRYPTASTTTEYTDAEIASQYGLTTEVLDNLARGIYTRVTITYIGTPHVWDYEVYFPYGGNKKLVLRNNLETSFKFERDSTTGKWKITNA